MYLKKIMPQQRVVPAVIVLTVIAAVLCGCSCAVKRGSRPGEEKARHVSVPVDELIQVQQVLEQRLSREIGERTVRLNMTERGLAISFVADALFDSEKSKLRPEAYPGLEAVGRVLTEYARGLRIGIEGHTDNEPVQASGWKSNWELSVARALSVLHYLQDEAHIEGWRLSATGYGEHQPAADNTTREGRQANRRVEIVIIPGISSAIEIGQPQGTQNAAVEMDPR